MTNWIEGTNIRLRSLETSDINKLYLMENEAETWDESNNIQPFSTTDLMSYITNQSNDIYADKQLRMVVCEKGSEKAIGLVDLYDFNPRQSHAWLGIMISKNQRGKGYAKEAIDLINKYAFGFLNIHTLLCSIGKSNIASIRAFESQGYERCGIIKEYKRKEGRFEDVIIMQKL